MPVYSRSKGLPNVVKNPPKLPIPLRLGNLSVDLNFEDYPSASINYEGIIEEDLGEFERIYQNFDRKITINGIPFRVAPDGGYNYERVGYLYRGEQQIDVYQVSITLESWWKQGVERGVKIKPLVDTQSGTVSIRAIAREVDVNYSGSNFEVPVGADVDINERISLSDVLTDYARINGGYVKYGKNVSIERLSSGSGYSFSWGEQQSDGTNTLGISPYYNGAELSWTEPEEEEQQDENEEVDPNQSPVYEPKESVTKVEVEGDSNPTQPPANTVKLRDLSSNFDRSGPTKTRRTTTTIDGKIDKEIIEIWGFMYLWEDGQFDSEDYWSINNPEAFWKKIEYTETTYIYEPIPNPIFTINTAAGSTVNRVVIHPDYTDYVKLVGTNNVEFNLGSIEYLTEIKISPSSWRMVRPVQESDAGGEYDSTEMDSDDPFQELIRWQKVRKYDATKFLIRNARADYQVNDAPYSVEWSLWEDLSPEIRNKVSSSGEGISVSNWGTDSRLQVGLVIPDLNYVPTYLAWIESRQSSSIIMLPHPESTADDPIPPIVTGEESYYQSKWVKKDEERATQQTVEFSAQDPGFDNSAQRTSYREIYGRPSEAEYRHRGWEETTPAAEDRGGNTTPTETNEPTIRYFLYSDDIPKWAGEGLSASFPNATSKNEALKAAETELVIQTLQSTQESRNLTWYFPDIDIMDSLNFEGDRFTGTFKVMSVSYTLEYNASDNKVGLDTICLCEGTDVTLGRLENRSVRVEEEVETADSSSGGGSEPQGEDAELETTQESFYEIGSVLPLTVPSRRNFNFK